MISIWYRHEHDKPDRIDQAPTLHQAARLALKYSLAFACLPGQDRFNRDKVWAGRRIDEPANPFANGGR
jgi:hypothetical protein